MPHKDKTTRNEYMRKYMLDRHSRRIAESIQKLGGKCAVCGSGEMSELEFDHIDPRTKSFTVGRVAASVAQDKLDAELEKCQLLCKECHKEKSSSSFEATRYGEFTCSCGQEFRDRMALAGHKRWCGT